MNYSMKVVIMIVGVLAAVAIISLTIVTVFAVTIDRPLITIDEHEDGSVTVYERENGTRLDSWANIDGMMSDTNGLKNLLEQLVERYDDGVGLTEIIVTK